MYFTKEKKIQQKVRPVLARLNDQPSPVSTSSPSLMTDTKLDGLPLRVESSLPEGKRGLPTRTSVDRSPLMANRQTGLRRGVHRH